MTQLNIHVKKTRTFVCVKCIFMTFVEMARISADLITHHDSSNLIYIDVKSVSIGTYGCKQTAHVQSNTTIDHKSTTNHNSKLEVRMVSSRKLVHCLDVKKKITPYLDELKPSSSHSPCFSIIPDSDTSERPNEKLVIQIKRYCTSMYVYIDGSSPETHTISSIERHEDCNILSTTYVSSVYIRELSNYKRPVYIGNISQHKSTVVRTELQVDTVTFIQFEIQLFLYPAMKCDNDSKRNQQIQDVPANVSSYQFISTFTMDAGSSASSVSTKELNALVITKMSALRPLKQGTCRRSHRRTTASAVGYLQYLILQSDLVLCDPLDEDDDLVLEDDDLVLEDDDLVLDCFTDLCWFDILDLDILNQIFHYLPTRDLAVLKCVCQDFKWLIEFFDITGIDSKWSPSGNYRDDPCMHCGKIKDLFGDVSLCHWHPKGFYKDGHYGRHYWICCRQVQEDSPGCMVGVHDNNWTTSRERLCHIPKPKRKPSWNSYWALIQ